MNTRADLILHNANIATLDRNQRHATALAVADGRFAAVGSDAQVMRTAGDATRIIDARGRRVIPGLIDSHIHVIRGGLNYNLELRWDGIPSLADAMRRLREQVARTPPPQWVRIVGGFTEHQFAERRLPTIDEINAVAPDTPVFILHLYDRALLNRAALRAVGYTKETPDPPGGMISRDSGGEPTGLLLAQPNAMLLYSALARGPKLPYDYQLNSTRHFMRELNRLGLTSVVDAGGGSQSYPEDYKVINDLHQAGLLTLRIAYNLFTQKPREELEDFTRWTSNNRYFQGDDFYRLNGAGEMLVFSAADFEDFRQERPNAPPAMEKDLEAVTRTLAENQWPWRMHATYDETISRALDVFEKVHRDVPINRLKWFFDHAETISDRNIDRIARLGGGIAVQHRMAYQGEYFVERYGAGAATRTPPIKRMLDMGLNVGVGTDATRVASYDPWTALYWLVAGKTVGGLRLYPAENRLDRETALGLYTHANTWFSNELGLKGKIQENQLADFAVLSDDYFSVEEEAIREIVSVLTVVAGKVVHGDAEFREFDPPLPPPAPDWSPANFGSRYWKEDRGVHAGAAVQRSTCLLHRQSRISARSVPIADGDRRNFWGALGCSCWAF